MSSKLSKIGDKTSTSSSNNRKLSLLFLFFFVVLILSRAQHSESLKFSSIQIPALVQRGSNFVLGCLYELERNEQLYSVKWYKGNEEFYKLQFSSSVAINNQQGAMDQPPPINAQHQNQYHFHQRNQQLLDSSGNAESAPNGQQQQYFSQAGVNVRMSLSNASHVHMLNASLESEGIYACEISTQSLSTIRYEKEIRVYVLPQTGLNVAGFRQRYALDERLELVCASDFTRPRAALAWFANGRRISKSSRFFQLDASTQTKPLDGLVKAILTLKFRLSGELLAALHADQSSSGRNQSAAASRLQVGQALRLQCKLRLAEVSDVAFNELALSSSTSSSGNDNNHVTVNRDDKTINSTAAGALNALRQPKPDYGDASSSWFGRVDLIDASGRAGAVREAATFDRAENPGGAHSDNLRAPGTGNQQIRRKRRSQAHMQTTVFKSSQGNQIVQSKSPASSEVELRRWFNENSGSSSASGCTSGALALQPDDPVLVRRRDYPDSSGSMRAGQSDNDNNNSDNQLWSDAGAWPNEQGRRRAQRKRQLDLNLSGGPNESDNIESRGTSDEELNVDCMTIGALLRQQSANLPAMLILGPPDQIDSDSNTSGGGGGGGGDNEMIKSDRLQHQTHVALPMQFCSDDQARRQWAIRGKSSYNEVPTSPPPGDPQLSGSGPKPAAWLWPANQRVAYVNISSVTNNNRKPRVSKLPLNARQRRLAVMQKQDFPTRSNKFQVPDRDEATSLQRPVLAPPLLEWFVNNHEAPNSSVQYEPELPMLATTSGFKNNGNTPRSYSDDSPEIAYNIDYAEYFANFDSKPMEQKLSLRLKLTEDHFLTPNSKLNLRCSSTQAQILMVDSVDLRIVLINSEHSIADHLQSTTNSWQKRRVPNHANGYHYQQTLATNNNFNYRVNQAKLLQQQQQQHGKSRAGADEPSILFVLLLVSIILML